MFSNNLPNCYYHNNCEFLNVIMYWDYLYLMLYTLNKWVGVDALIRQVVVIVSRVLFEHALKNESNFKELLNNPKQIYFSEKISTWQTKRYQ